MIKLIFFDYDLTIADTRKFVKKSYNALCKASGVKPTKKGFEAYTGKRVSENIKFFSEISKRKKSEQELYKVFFDAHKDEEKKAKLYNKEIFSLLKNKKIKIIIISNNSKKIIQKVLQYNKMHFDKIIADEDMKKGEEKHEKILSELKKLGLKKDAALYVGDHINDIEEARKAGIKIASVTTGVFSKNELKKYKPDFIIENLSELKKVIMPIKNIIFDIGGVFVWKDWESIKKEMMEKHGFSTRIYSDYPKKVQANYKNVLIGKASLKDVFKIISQKKNLKKILEDYESLNKKYQCVNKPLLDYANLLKKNYKLYCLTDVSDLHYQFHKKNGIYKPFIKTYASCKIGIRKPNRKIFLRVLKENNLNPVETLFVDDIESNVEKAKSLGIKGIIFKSNQDLFKKFLELGIKI